MKVMEEWLDWATKVVDQHNAFSDDYRERRWQEQCRWTPPYDGVCTMLWLFVIIEALVFAI